MTFGERLKEAREAAGVSQMKLAAEIGVARSNISSWESGAFGLPAADVLVRIAKRFGRSERWFVTGEASGAELGPFESARGMFLAGAADAVHAQAWLDSSAFRAPTATNARELLDALESSYARFVRAEAVASAGGDVRDVGLALGGVGSRVESAPDDEGAPRKLAPVKRRSSQK